MNHTMTRTNDDEQERTDYFMTLLAVACLSIFAAGNVFFGPDLGEVASDLRSAMVLPERDPYATEAPQVVLAEAQR